MAQTPAKTRTTAKKRSAKPTKALAERKAKAEQDAERKMAARVERVQQLTRRLVPHSSMVRMLADDWKLTHEETNAIIDRAYEMLVDRHADPKYTARAKSEIRECHRHLYGKLSTQSDWRAWSAATKPLDYLAKLDGLYEPERQDINLNHHAELAHLGYTSEEDLLQAIDLGLQQALDLGSLDGDGE